jgi:pre-mRNA-splicing factor RBM22/SLT11
LEKVYIVTIDYDRGFFYVFGDIKSVIVAHKTKCAFINFTTRTSAELAANKVAEVGLNLKGHALRVVWARPKPQSNQSDNNKTSKIMMK